MIRRSHGFALLDLMFVCGIIGLITAIAMPSLVQAKQAAGSASAIGSLRAIDSAQLTYALTCGNGFYAPDLVTLGHPPAGSDEGYIASDLAAGTSIQKSGYVITMSAAPYDGAPASCNGVDAGAGGQGFKAGADPSDPANVRFFGTNATQEIYENTSTLYGAMPEVGEPAVGQPIR